MNAERHQRVMDLLGEALEREPESRAAWIEAACAGDQVLCDDVMRLLAQQTSAAQFLEESPLAAAVGTEKSDARSLVGEHIGLYKIISEIGRGGMGTVYLAERDDQQFTRRVAVKLIKRGMDTDFVVQRFRNERQILAKSGSSEHRPATRRRRNGSRPALLHHGVCRGPADHRVCECEAQPNYR